MPPMCKFTSLILAVRHFDSVGVRRLKTSIGANSQHIFSGDSCCRGLCRYVLPSSLGSLPMASVSLIGIKRHLASLGDSQGLDQTDQTTRVEANELCS